MFGESKCSPNSCLTILKIEFARLTFLWGSLSVRVAFTPSIASLLSLALVLALYVALPRPVLVKALALSRPIVSLLLSFGK